MERYTKKESTYNEKAMQRLQEYENKCENGLLVELPSNVILNDYDKKQAQNITSEEIKFTIGQKAYAVYDSVLHFYNCKPIKPKYKLVEGIIREIFHKYDNFNNHFKALVALNLDEKGTHQYFSQKQVFADKTKAEARLKELKERANERNTF